MHMVFVYGTLKRGFSNHCYLANSRFLGAGTTVSQFKMLTVGFPVLIDNDRHSSADSGRVQGEVYLVNDATLARLDMLEGVSSGMYRRELRRISIYGRTRLCFIYIGNHDHFRGFRTLAPNAGHHNWQSGRH